MIDEEWKRVLCPLPSFKLTNSLQPRRLGCNGPFGRGPSKPVDIKKTEQSIMILSQLRDRQARAISCELGSSVD